MSEVSAVNDNHRKKDSQGKRDLVRAVLERTKGEDDEVRPGAHDEVEEIGT